MLPIRHILVPVDFSPCSRRALEYAFALAGAHQAKITALYVGTGPMRRSSSQPRGPKGETLESLGKEAADREMKEFLAPIQVPSGVAMTTKIRFGEADDEIVDEAKTHDLIVMGTNGRTGLSLMVVGSIAENVVRGAPCPVLTVKANA